MNNKYYTYAYLREDGTPYYIGKGKGNRAYVRRQRRISPPVDKDKIILLKKNLTEEEAFKHEIYMISVFGRKDLGTGILWNNTDGGEGPSGMIHSKEAKKKMSDTARNRIWTDKQRREVSERNKRMGIWCGENNPALKRKGKKLEIPFSEEHKKNLSEAHRGNQNHKGHKHSEETKQRMREKALEREAKKRELKLGTSKVF
jgi:hypothetical protein